MCGRLRKAMYGTRDAMQTWQGKCSEIVKDIDFTIGKASPCHFYTSDQEVCGLAHGDGFVFVGEKGHLKRIEDHMQKKFKVEVA